MTEKIFISWEFYDSEEFHEWVRSLLEQGNGAK